MYLGEKVKGQWFHTFFKKDGTKLKRPYEIKTPLSKLLNILKKPTMTGNPNQKTTSFQPKQTQILFTILLRRFLISRRKWRIWRKIGNFPNAIWTFLRLWDLHLFSTGRGAFKTTKIFLKTSQQPILNPELANFFREICWFWPGFKKFLIETQNGPKNTDITVCNTQNANLQPFE